MPALMPSQSMQISLVIAAFASAMGACSGDESRAAEDAGGSGSAGASAGTAGQGGGGSPTSATGGTAGSAATGGASGAGLSGASGAGGGVGGAGGGGAGGGGAGGASGADAGDAGAISPLPLVVDSVFAASGYMGNAANPGATIAQDLVSCVSTRPPGAEGRCHKFTYTPAPPPVAGQASWAGVYWQFPADNWGTLPGKRIAPGATKVSFYAAGATGGEVVTFFVGGLAGTLYSDTLTKVALPPQVLTTTMTLYSIPLTGYSYDTVIGGFAWTIEVPPIDDGGTSSDATTSDAATTDAGRQAITFTVDGIRWE